jgi:hypothetical protein
MDLPDTWLMPSWNSRELDVPNYTDMLLDSAGDVSLDDLAVIAVKLHEKVICLDSINDCAGMINSVEKVSWHSGRDVSVSDPKRAIYRFDHGMESGRLKFVGRILQVLDEGSFGDFRTHSGAWNPCQ